MKTLLLVLALGLGGCATITAESEQSIEVTTTPAGASCALTNKVGIWEVTKTPGSAEVTRSFSPLTINCRKGRLAGTATLEPKTRGRAYGNILLLGVPAIVDAGTGKGYEYAPASADILLK